MSRYVRSAQIVADPTTEQLCHLSGEVVLCDDPGGIPTGLLDATGTPIMRLPDPIGFDLTVRRGRRP